LPVDVLTQHVHVRTTLASGSRSYPKDLPDHQHRTTLYLPTPIALALARRPELIQKAVEAFYTRDPSQLRRVAKMTTFSPTPENTTRTQVELTRVAFAQLEGQEFFPSKAFGPEWASKIGEASAEGAQRTRGVKVVSARIRSAPALMHPLTPPFWCYLGRPSASRSSSAKARHGHSSIRSSTHLLAPCVAAQLSCALAGRG
jgi:hypothetical protein